MTSQSNTSTIYNLRITESDDDKDYIDLDETIVKKQVPKQKYTKRKNSKKFIPNKSTKTTYKYSKGELVNAFNILNATDSFCDNINKFEELYCIQNIYKYDTTAVKALDSLPRLFQEAIACLENRDWKNFVLVIIKALQFPTISRSLVKNLVLMEVLYDPTIKNSEIANQCLSIIFGSNIKHDDLIKNLTSVPVSRTKLSDEKDAKSDDNEIEI